MPSAADIQKALESGRKQAESVVKDRNKILKKRAKAIEKAQLPRRVPTPKPRHPLAAGVPTPSSPPAVQRPAPVPPPPPPPGTVPFTATQDLGPQGHSTLIAEGDSWFDYPGDDVLRVLEDHHGYEVESVAHWGDRVEEMAYTDGQLDALTRLIEKVLRNGRKPRAILLSGGGNDIAGEEFGMLLNHASSPVGGLNESIVKGVIDERISLAYVEIISRVTRVCELRIGARTPILIHGYDYPVPDGRGFFGGWWFLPGPWLEPGFREKGFGVLQERILITKTLIDRFNSMLQSLVSMQDFEHVRYVNLRNTLAVSDDSDEYGPDWANELHPTPRGFEKVTDKFAAVLAGLPVE